MSDKPNVRIFDSVNRSVFESRVGRLSEMGLTSPSVAGSSTLKTIAVDKRRYCHLIFLCFWLVVSLIKVYINWYVSACRLQVICIFHTWKWVTCSAVSCTSAMCSIQRMM